MKQLPDGFVVCIRRAEYAASLEPWKLYRVLPDPEAARLGQVRIVDESGEDFLYPTEWFQAVKLPAALARLFTARAGH